MNHLRWNIISFYYLELLLWDYRESCRFILHRIKVALAVLYSILAFYFLLYSIKGESIGIVKVFDIRFLTDLQVMGMSWTRFHYFSKCICLSNIRWTVHGISIFYNQKRVTKSFRGRRTNCIVKKCSWSPCIR